MAPGLCYEAGRLHLLHSLCGTWENELAQLLTCRQVTAVPLRDCAVHAKLFIASFLNLYFFKIHLGTYMLYCLLLGKRIGFFTSESLYKIIDWKLVCFCFILTKPDFKTIESTFIWIFLLSMFTGILLLNWKWGYMCMYISCMCFHVFSDWCLYFLVCLKALLIRDLMLLRKVALEKGLAAWRPEACSYHSLLYPVFVISEQLKSNGHIYRAINLFVCPVWGWEGSRFALCDVFCKS